jgi:hypothetical protein
MWTLRSCRSLHSLACCLFLVVLSVEASCDTGRLYQNQSHERRIPSECLDHSGMGCGAPRGVFLPSPRCPFLRPAPSSLPLADSRPLVLLHLSDTHFSTNTHKHYWEKFGDRWVSVGGRGASALQKMVALSPWLND